MQVTLNNLRLLSSPFIFFFCFKYLASNQGETQNLQLIYGILANVIFSMCSWKSFCNGQLELVFVTCILITYINKMIFRMKTIS